jgi:hypothetical protein
MSTLSKSAGILILRNKSKKDLKKVIENIVFNNKTLYFNYV